MICMTVYKDPLLHLNQKATAYTNDSKRTHMRSKQCIVRSLGSSKTNMKEWGLSRKCAKIEIDAQGCSFSPYSTKSNYFCS